MSRGLGPINASSMYARGGTGRGIVVGVFDSGATPTHPDLRGAYRRIGPPGVTDGIDQDGHGTGVASLIAARRNGDYILGVAFEAQIDSWNFDGDDGSAADDAAGLRWLRSGGVRIVNNSWSTTIRNDRFLNPVGTAQVGYPVYDGPILGDIRLREGEVEQLYGGPRLTEWRNDVNAGTVHVWAAGNGSWRENPGTGHPVIIGRGQPSLPAGLPHYFPELEAGWLAVVAVTTAGDETVYTDRCGDATAWCLAAVGGGNPFGEASAPDPGSLLWLTNNGGIEPGAGTSAAAPHVAGGLAALKSMFPNLTFHQVRTRILHTADRDGRYAWTGDNAGGAIFGQGLLDLDAASMPVGGTLLALSAHDEGPVAPTRGARLALSRAALRTLDGRTMLVFDDYQRAPFRVALDGFAAERTGPRLSLADALANDGPMWSDAHGETRGEFAFAGARGAGALQGLSRTLGATPGTLPYALSDDALSAGLARTGAGTTLRLLMATTPPGAEEGAIATGGLAHWRPRTVLGAELAPVDARWSAGLSFADALRRPGSWEADGAFAAGGRSVGVTFGTRLLERNGALVVVRGHLAHLESRSQGPVSFDDALVAHGALDARAALSPRWTLEGHLTVEGPLDGGDATLRLADNIDENGRIGFEHVAINRDPMLRFMRARMGVRYDASPRTSVQAGAALARDGTGAKDAVIGVRALVRF